MNNTHKVRRRFEWRILLFRAVVLMGFCLLLLRLGNLQWLQHEGLLLQAEQNRINVIPLLPTRGEMTDRFGTGIAINHVSYRVLLIPERVTDMAHTLDILSTRLHWNPAHFANIKKHIAHARPDRPVLLDDQLPWETVAPLAARLYRLPGIDVQAGTHRYYPYGTLTSHLVGYLSRVNAANVRAGMLPEEKAGRSGAEQAFESRLHGHLGSQQEEVDAHGRRVRVLQSQPPLTGEKIRLSLDMDVQKAAADALGTRTGAVVVMDVHTGELLALLSQPGFDTNYFVTGLGIKRWQAWLHDSRRPLINRAIQSAYPPGSTFKLLTSIAGLHHHLPIIRSGTSCPGYLDVGQRTLRCWKHTGHRRINLYRALVESCDVFFYTMGGQLGMDRLRTEAVQWGFGAPTGIVLTSEVQGAAPGGFRQRHRGQQWFTGETMIASIGQGSINATPIQMARFVAAIANGGHLLRPRIEAGLSPDVMSVIPVQPSDLAQVQKAMRGVVTEIHGTAHASLANLPWTVAGKTGTAQVVAMPQTNEKDKNKSFLHKDHAWFAGYAPYESPRIAFAILIEHGGHGGSAAGPVAAAIIRAMANKN